MLLLSPIFLRLADVSLVAELGHLLGLGEELLGLVGISLLDWQRFYHAVDELQPDLMERIAQHLGKFTEQQQQVCYLLSIGLTNTQIENLTDIPHVTVWRWVKKHHGHHPRGHPLNKVQDFAEWAEVGNAKSPPACSARLCRFACKEHPQRLEV